MAESNKYDGMRVIAHVVSRSESLSQIARSYRLPHWRPLYIYNTEFYQVLGPDPDRVERGVTIFVPRTAAGYKALLSKLHTLKRDISTFGANERGRLERDWNLHQADRVLFDLAGDLGTFFASLGVKAVEASKALRVAGTTTGRGAAAAKYLADRQVEKLSDWVYSELADKAKMFVAANADQQYQRRTGSRAAPVAATAQGAKTGKKAYDAATGFSLRGGKAFLDVADLLLDFVSVSNVADLYLKGTTGETTEQTFRKQSQAVEAMMSKSIQNVDVKIRRYADEKKRLYG